MSRKVKKHRVESASKALRKLNEASQADATLFSNYVSSMLSQKQLQKTKGLKMKPIIGIATIFELAYLSTLHLRPSNDWEAICNEVDTKLTEGWYIGEEAEAARMLLDVCIAKQGEYHGEN